MKKGIKKSHLFQELEEEGELGLSQPIGLFVFFSVMGMSQEEKKRSTDKREQRASFIARKLVTWLRSL
ncbi:MAG: hypothetical protein N2112_05850 [Gemmataceae bacterium]|jgi:hypothetical protein|nr:hypothetical protein [Gemmataceae bacterium]